MTETPWITTRLVDLVSNLGRYVESIGAGPVCWLGVSPGAATAWDSCGECDGEKCGKTYVVLSQVIEYDSFPNPREWVQGGSPAGLAYQLEVGTLRCMPIQEDGEAIDSGDSLATMTGLNDDMIAMLCAIRETFAPYLLSVTQYSPVGPEGGCVGGVWEVVVAA